ncbi:MAG: UDP-N-acetylmuramate dehydrogenase [Odoribacteraceae bacterium]|jgi:UDP-N-acetylmuramate dehydrogenase|nr:UDP-N-acetylmuramate dehydrogenase [Odoribacteraceae bacterium]
MILINELAALKKRNTFGVEATCRRWVECDNEEELLNFITADGLKPGDFFVLGGGSNVLFTADYQGAIIHPAIRGRKLAGAEGTDILVRVGAGESWDEFVSWAVDRGFWGVENLSMIPGRVGAAPVQNIGAYGVEIGDRVARVEAIDAERGERVTLDGVACRFGYRDSIFKNEWRDRFIVTRVTFRLSKTPCPRLDYKGVQEEIDREGEPTLPVIRRAITRLRESKLPDVRAMGNAGSFFKNPVVEQALADRLLEKHPKMPVYPAGEGQVKLAAAWLVERSGSKKSTIGGAGVHDKQALVLVNKRGATGDDILRLANEIQRGVLLRFGVQLQPEVTIL